MKKEICISCENHFDITELNRGMCEKCKEQDDKDVDIMIDDYMDSQPELTAEEKKKESESWDKCADYIMEKGISPNLDSIY